MAFFSRLEKGIILVQHIRRFRALKLCMDRQCGPRQKNDILSSKRAAGTVPPNNKHQRLERNIIHQAGIELICGRRQEEPQSRPWLMHQRPVPRWPEHSRPLQSRPWHAAGRVKLRTCVRIGGAIRVIIVRECGMDRRRHQRRL